jgi:beta-phosphoglucomutase-like phosphatase (HAD superfamily)
VLADLGWNLALDEIVERFVGRSEAHFVATVERQLGLELAAGWDRKYEPWYRGAFERGLTAVDGIVEALDELRLPHCVASSGTHAKMRRTLGQTGLWHRFEGRIFSATDVDNGNRPRICSCTPPERSAPHRSAAPSSKTAPTASKPPVRQGCTSSRTPAG